MNVSIKLTSCPYFVHSCALNLQEVASIYVILIWIDIKARRKTAYHTYHLVDIYTRVQTPSNISKFTSRLAI